ncbi:MAG TPA: hypothetical protein DCZ95_11180 [Verrucomicrobia bacterium]|nr:MAG: hypothetical protein A2X46_07805 [Lentisphaerae bacterium GWF2_57_35]HBA84647.1 hypothetical protein [Verrucomicrobiota bacterium]
MRDEQNSTFATADAAERIEQRKPGKREQEHRGRLAFYHANSQGTGTAIQFELRMNRPGEDRYDCIFMEMAKQKSLVTTSNDQRKPATFDWSNKVTVKLDFSDICAMLLVLEGRREKISDSRSGLYHEAAGSSTIISLDKSTKQSGCYLGISKKAKGGDSIFKGQILLDDAESLGLKSVLQSSLFFIAFHKNLNEM